VRAQLEAARAALVPASLPAAVSANELIANVI
jgi:hypothetical protein